MLIKLTDNKTGNSVRDVSRTYLTSGSEALSELSHFNSLLIHVWAKRRGTCGLRGLPHVASTQPTVTQTYPPSVLQRFGP